VLRAYSYSELFGSDELRAKGLSEDVVLGKLREMRDRDLKFDRLFSTMCTRPHPIALKAHQLFLESNLGDPGLFPGSVEIERQAIRMMGDLLGYPEAIGYLSTGGTESNIQAIRAARNYAGISDSNIVVPESAHFSFEKIGDLLNLEVRRAELDEELRVDPGSVEDLIDNKTVALVGIAGTTEFGQVDPIPQLAEIALRYGLHLHVDAAFGGFVLPFLEKEWLWDFRVEGVSSITIDPHKMGLSTIPGGGLLFKSPDYLRMLAVDTPYLTAPSQESLTGTRSGATAAATWAVMMHLGRDGFAEVVRYCMDLTKQFVAGARKIGVETVIEPPMNVVALNVKSPDEVRSELMEHQWQVSITRSPRALRMVVMPHMTSDNVDLFLRDLEAVLLK
jgi:tyrosine decarboxylase/aspartate 1-decarboxylase